MTADALTHLRLALHALQAELEQWPPFSERRRVLLAEAESLRGQIARLREAA